MKSKVVLKGVVPPIMWNSARRLKTQRRPRFRTQELDAEFYDENLSRNPHYQVEPWRSPYYFAWTVIGDRLQRDPRPCGLLEIGCGTGQLAAYIDSLGIAGYCGFDFSAKRVAWARDEWPRLRFEVADAYSTDLFREHDYDTVLCTEVLEHIDDDLGIIQRTRAGVRFIATVPNFPADGHVRHFASAEAVADRYSEVLVELSVTELRKSAESVLYLIDGVTA